MIQFLEKLNAFVWGLPALVLIISVGLCLSVRTRFAQFRLFPRAAISFFRPFLGKGDETDSKKKRALCMALAATVGTGNLAGVAGAIALGGPGAVFWMWLCAALGMITKMAEASLAVRYRRRDRSAEVYGGPMYMILDAMKPRWHWLAYVYCFFGLVASFGIGNATQVNTVISSLRVTFSGFGIQLDGVINVLIGMLFAIIIFRVLSGGAGSIGKVAERLIPAASLFYVLLALGGIALRWQAIPEAFASILRGAFCPEAITGGAVGSMFLSLRVGAARGVFTNEAGMGTAAIAHATADVREPVEQGFMGIIEVFIDTVVICTATALVILCSGVQIPYGTDVGIALTAEAFCAIFGGWVEIFISAALCLFAFATILGWGFYGMQCARFIFGTGSKRVFVALQTVMVVIGAVFPTHILWLTAEIVNGLMAIPNLTVLWLLIPEVSSMIQLYEVKMPGVHSTGRSPMLSDEIEMKKNSVC